MKGTLVRELVSEDRVFDFDKMSNGLGIRHFSFRNMGDTAVVFDDATREAVLPDETFVIESEIDIVQTVLRIRFDEDDTHRNNALAVRYIIPLDC